MSSEWQGWGTWWRRPPRWPPAWWSPPMRARSWPRSWWSQWLSRDWARRSCCFGSFAENIFDIILPHEHSIKKDLNCTRIYFARRYKILTLNLCDLKTLRKRAQMFHHSCWWSRRIDSTSSSSSSDSSFGESYSNILFLFINGRNLRSSVFS